MITKDGRGYPLPFDWIVAIERKRRELTHNRRNGLPIDRLVGFADLLMQDSHEARLRITDEAEQDRYRRLSYFVNEALSQEGLPG